MKYIQVTASVSFKNNHLLLYCLVCGHFILSFACWFVCASVCQTAGFVFQIMQLKVALKKLSIRKLQRYSRHLSQFVFKKILLSKDLEPWITCVYILYTHCLSSQSVKSCCSLRCGLCCQIMHKMSFDVWTSTHCLWHLCTLQVNGPLLKST